MCWHASFVSEAHNLGPSLAEYPFICWEGHSFSPLLASKYFPGAAVSSPHLLPRNGDFLPVISCNVCACSPYFSLQRTSGDSGMLTPVWKPSRGVPSSNAGAKQLQIFHEMLGISFNPQKYVFFFFLSCCSFLSSVGAVPNSIAICSLNYNPCHICRV